MRHHLILLLTVASALLMSGGCANQGGGISQSEGSKLTPANAASAQWAVNLDNIEACSCPLFCQCYFNERPALHQTGSGDAQHAMRFCRFNNAFRINQGHFNDTKLDGMKFWMAGDLGGDFSKGQMDWAVVHFEPSATPPQRDAAKAIVAAIFPVKWNSFTTGADAKIDWNRTADGAEALLDDGKAAQIVLKTTRGNEGKPVVLKNVKFWAAPRNSGFEMMASELEAYRAGDKPFEFKNTNGFSTTIDMNANDVAKGHAAGFSSN